MDKNKYTFENNNLNTNICGAENFRTYPDAIRNCDCRPFSCNTNYTYFNSNQRSLEYKSVNTTIKYYWIILEVATLRKLNMNNWLIPQYCRLFV